MVEERVTSTKTVAILVQNPIIPVVSSVVMSIPCQKGNLVCDGKAGRVTITDGLVVGKAVEQSWRLAYRPSVGVLPLPIDLQEPLDIPSVKFANVTRSRCEKLGTRDVEVTEFDSALAIEISQTVVRKLCGVPYGFQILTVDHTGPSGAEAHDLLLSANLGGESRFPPGLVSTEVVLRDVGRPAAYAWAETICREALPMFRREADFRPRVWLGRIVVMVQLGRDRDRRLKLVDTHGLLRRKAASSATCRHH